MKKVKIKIPAKININLDVSPVEREKGFHPIKSLVASVNIYDYITIKKRQDNQITLTTTGLKLDCPIQENNAYKTASAYIGEYSLGGVDIEIQKNIPVCGGMGGSSADISGVLLGLKKLFGVKCDMLEFANRFGSDAGYMLKGGYAVLGGKGEQVSPLNIKQKIYLLLITQSAEQAKTVSAKECYKEFDNQGLVYAPTTQIAVENLLSKNINGLFKVIKNDLYPSAKTLLPQIETALNGLAQYCPAVLTGSGATVVGYFKTKRERDIVYKKLYEQHGDNLIKAKII